MSTIFANCCFSYRNKSLLNTKSAGSNSIRRIKGFCLQSKIRDDDVRDFDDILGRRSVLVSSGLCFASGLVLGFPTKGLAAVKQGLLAGRIPGLSEPDENEGRVRPSFLYLEGEHYNLVDVNSLDQCEISKKLNVSAGASGTFSDWVLTRAPVSIQWALVPPAPGDLGDDAKIEQIGTPEKVINAFGPEVIGENVEGKVLRMEETDHTGRKYYQFELEPPHVLISATAAGNRFYLFGVTASGLQWKKHYKDLKQIADSFHVL